MQRERYNHRLPSPRRRVNNGKRIYIGMGSDRVASSCIFLAEGFGKQSTEAGKTRSECECKMCDDKSAISSFRLSLRTAYIANYFELSRCDRGANTNDIICCLFRVGV